MANNRIKKPIGRRGVAREVEAKLGGPHALRGTLYPVVLCGARREMHAGLILQHLVKLLTDNATLLGQRCCVRSKWDLIDLVMRNHKGSSNTRRYRHLIFPLVPTLSIYNFLCENSKEKEAHTIKDIFKPPNGFLHEGWGGNQCLNL